MVVFNLKRRRTISSYLSVLRKRLGATANTPVLSARISAPDSLRWWYWQEFGTATRGDAGRASGKPFDIFPVKAQALRWPDATHPNRLDGSRITGAVIDHPGIPAKHYITKIRPALRIEAGNMFARSLAKQLRTSNFNVGSLRSDLLRKIMPIMVDMIGDSMSVELPGTRPDGKLKGLPAHVVFRRESFVRNTGD